MSPEQELTVRRHLRVLREMANDYQHNAVGAESSKSYEKAKRHRERYHACLWALREHDPMIEGPRQTLDSMASIMKEASAW